MGEEIMAVQELHEQINGLTRELLQTQQEAAAYRNQKDKLVAQIANQESVIESLHEENTRLKAELYEYITACGGLLEV